MKILFVCHRFPYPPRSGANVRAFHIIRHLSAAGHEVTVVSLVRSSREAEDGTGIAPYCKHYEMVRVFNLFQIARMIWRLPTFIPSTMGFFYSPTLAKRIKQLVAEES